MSKIAGVDVLVEVNTGSDTTPVWSPVGGQTDATLSRSANEVDVSAKTDEGGYGEFLAGRKTWTVEGSGFIVDGDEGLQAMEDAFENRVKVQVKMAFPSGRVYSGFAYITEYSFEFPFEDGASYSITLSGASGLSVTTEDGDGGVEG